MDHDGGQDPWGYGKDPYHSFVKKWRYYLWKSKPYVIAYGFLHARED
jgi:hypothetical protein